VENDNFQMKKCSDKRAEQMPLGRAARDSERFRRFAYAVDFGLAN
jgi:hypothetical protein